MQSRYATDPDFLALVARIENREITRKQAADLIGCSVETLNSRLRRAKVIDRLKPVRNYTGDHLFKGDPDKAKRYDEAIATIQNASPKRTIKSIWREQFPDLDYVYLTRKLKQAKEAQPQ